MEKYLKMTFDGSTFPDDPYRIVKVSMGDHIVKKYLPAFERAIPDAQLGKRLLLAVMADTEGFRPGTRSFRNNNPGNIGNTDSGTNVNYLTLEDGIRAQVNHLDKILAGKSKYYPIGKAVHLPPGYSPEMEHNKKVYDVKSGYYPGYRFVFTGQLDQYVKIYATLARVNNSYVNRIVSWFHQNGFTGVTPESKIQDLVKLNREVSSTPVKRILTSGGKGVNVRSGPGTQFAIISTLGEGEQITVLSENNGWYQIGNSPGGWVKAEFVK